MKGWLQILGFTALLAGQVLANEVELQSDETHRQRCSGMYSRKAWGGNVDPFILVKFSKAGNSNGDPLASLVIFEWGDESLIGASRPDNPDVRQTICDAANVKANLCTKNQLGSFLLSKNASDVSKSPIISRAIHLKDPDAIKYPIKKTGFYCVSTYAYSTEDYKAVITFRNSYGELPATQVPKLPFYGAMTIVYAAIGLFWLFLYVQNRHDILPVQNYITAILVFLVVEQLMTWGFYDYQNRHDLNVMAKVLMVLVAILNAGRNAFSFFLLLIVCMGYGVVKPSLGRTMIYVRILAIAHFIFAVVYSITSLSITPDSAGLLVLIVVLPLAGTLTAFYVWTLNSLSATTKDLIERKQKTKALMYKKLWWCILGSIVVIFGFFFLNSFALAGSTAASFVPTHWQMRWFVLDGWLNLVYLFDIGFVAYLWRPTANNRRFAMSDELAQDDDGFEIRSFGSGLDEEDPFEAPPEYPGSSAEGRRDLSPIPPKPFSAAPQRPSLDDETIFAVGEEADKWSEDDEDIHNSMERQRLTRAD